MTKHALVALSVLGLVTLAGSASAEEKEAKAPGTVTTLRTITVVGNRVRPSVAIEVARARPEIKLKDLQDPQVEKIIRAAAKAPF